MPRLLSQALVLDEDPAVSRILRGYFVTRAKPLVVRDAEVVSLESVRRAKERDRT
jgi:hypothetical protein